MSNYKMFDTQTRTELHTHFLSLLSGDGFLILLKNYYPVIKDALRNPNVPSSATNILMDVENLTIEELKKKLTIYDTLDRTVETMSTFFKNRRELLAVFQILVKEYPFLKILDMVKHTSSSPEIKKHYFDLYCSKTLSDRDLVNGLIFSEYINMALQELINQGVKYVEISYSNLTIIQSLYLKKEIRDQIECRFMLCTNRENLAFIADPESAPRKERKKYTYQKDSAPSLRKGLEWSDERILADTLEGSQTCIVGFDIMGQENKLRTEEKDRDPNNPDGFINKLKIILKVLQEDYQKTGRMNTFRIHGGEVPGTEDNIFHTLTMLKELVPISPLGTIPPPEIRIGHGVFFRDIPEYFDLLREMQVIIEINASSNIKLGNILRVTDIRYQRYLEEGIPIVISTDGHGLYDTTIEEENEKAKSVVGPYFDIVLATDEYLLGTKIRR